MPDLIHRIKDEIVKKSATKTEVVKELAFEITPYPKTLRFRTERHVRHTVNEMIANGIIIYKVRKPLQLDKVAWAKYRVLNS